MCKHGPRGMAVTYRRRKPAMPYKTRLTGRLMLLTKAFSKKTRLTENEGFGVTRRTPRHFERTVIPGWAPKAPPDDRLREAIQLPEKLDCFVASRPGMTLRQTANPA